MRWRGFDACAGSTCTPGMGNANDRSLYITGAIHRRVARLAAPTCLAPRHMALSFVDVDQVGDDSYERLSAHCEAVLKFVRILLEAFPIAPVDTTVAPAVVQCRATGPGGPFRTYSGRPPVTALPYGRDPVTCPPCAHVRWRQVLHAWDTTDPDGRRRAVMTVLRRQTATAGSGGDDGEIEPQHCCRGARFAEPADPDRALFPSVHATGAIGSKPMTGHAINEMIRRRAAAGFTPAQVARLG